MPVPLRESKSKNRPTWARLVQIGLSAGLVCSCANSQVTMEGAYSKVKPKAQLSEPEQRNDPENLLVAIHNVADTRTSFKNYVVLYVNDHEVVAPEGVNNISSAYRYAMRLQDGVYDVRAEYHTVGYWRERVYTILPEEPVKIMPNQRTVMDVRLKKDENGALTKSPARFRVRYETLVAATQMPH